jgi:hypothetical protein
MSSLVGDIIKVTSLKNWILTDINSNVKVEVYVRFDSLSNHFTKTFARTVYCGFFCFTLKPRNVACKYAKRWQCRRL